MSLQSIKRDRLYCGQYQYRATCKVRQAYRLRYLRTASDLDGLKTVYVSDHDNITMPYSRLSGMGTVGTVSTDRRSDSAMTSNDYLVLRRLLEFKNAHTQTVLMRVESSSVYVYSNDLELLRRIAVFVNDFSVTAALVKPDAGTVLHRRHSLYTHRTYLREQRITSDTQRELLQWFQRYDQVQASLALRRWLGLEKTLRISWYNLDRVRSDYYFEHNDTAIITVFELCFPRLARRTMEIKAAG